MQAGGQRFDPAMLHQIQLLRMQKMNGRGTKLVRNRQDHDVIAVEFGVNRSAVCFMIWLSIILLNDLMVLNWLLVIFVEKKFYGLTSNLGCLIVCYCIL